MEACGSEVPGVVPDPVQENHAGSSVVEASEENRGIPQEDRSVSAHTAAADRSAEGYDDEAIRRSWRLFVATRSRSDRGSKPSSTIDRLSIGRRNRPPASEESLLALHEELRSTSGMQLLAQLQAAPQVYKYRVIPFFSRSCGPLPIGSCEGFGPLVVQGVSGVNDEGAPVIQSVENGHHYCNRRRTEEREVLCAGYANTQCEPCKLVEPKVNDEDAEVKPNAKTGRYCCSLEWKTTSHDIRCEENEYEDTRCDSCRELRSDGKIETNRKRAPVKCNKQTGHYYCSRALKCEAEEGSDWRCESCKLLGTVADSGHMVLAPANRDGAEVQLDEVTRQYYCSRAFKCEEKQGADTRCNSCKLLGTFPCNREGVSVTLNQETGHYCCSRAFQCEENEWGSDTRCQSCKLLAKDGRITRITDNGEDVPVKCDEETGHYYCSRALKCEAEEGSDRRCESCKLLGTVADSGYEISRCNRDGAEVQLDEVTRQYYCSRALKCEEKQGADTRCNSCRRLATFPFPSNREGAPVKLNDSTERYYCGRARTKNIVFRCDEQDEQESRMNKRAREQESVAGVPVAWRFCCRRARINNHQAGHGSGADVEIPGADSEGSDFQSDSKIFHDLTVKRRCESCERLEGAAPHFNGDGAPVTLSPARGHYLCGRTRTAQMPADCGRFHRSHEKGDDESSQCDSCRRFQESHTIGELTQGTTAEWIRRRRLQERIAWRSGGSMGQIILGKWLDDECKLSLRLVSTESLFKFYLDPASFKYAAWAGLRLGFGSARSRQECCVTVLSVNDGCVIAREDNCTEDNDAKRVITPMVGSVVRTKAFRYAPGSRIQVLIGSTLADAQVVSPLGQQHGSRHQLRLMGRDRSQADAGGAVIDMDLNTMNHCSQRFESVAKYEAVRGEYCKRVLDLTHLAEDGITGRKLSVVDQILRIKTSTIVGEKAAADHEARKYADVKSIAELVPHLLRPNPRRANGAHQSQPVLVRAEAGTGKTWSMQQLTHLVARELCGDTATVQTDPVGLVPLLIPVQKLARVLRLHASGIGSACNQNPIALYIRDMFPGEMQDMLVQALELRAIIVLLDGIDEAADLSQMIEDFVTCDLVAMGVPFVATSRPEGVHIERYKQDFVVLDLCPLDAAQQLLMIQNQGVRSEFLKHLIAFSEVRQKHDEIYEKAFGVKDREYLEQLKIRDGFKLPDGQADPAMRQHTQDAQGGERVIQEIQDGVARQSRYLQALEKGLSGQLRDLDSMLASPEEVSHDDLKDEVYRIMENQAHDVKDELKQIMKGASFEVDPSDVVHKLCMLVRKLKKKGGHDVLASSLWSRITSRTDELLTVAEQLWPVFMHVVHELVKMAGLDPGQSLKVGPLKDPVRIHEKAEGDYKDRFPHSLPEANVVDVIRVRLVCDSGSKMRKVIEVLQKGFKTTFEGDPVRLELVRCKNKFPAAADPTHFRNILNNLRLSYQGSSHLLEMQVHHREILNHNDESHAHDHYDFFRASLESRYETELDSMLSTLETRMTLLDRVCRVPVLLSVLVCALDDDEQKVCFPSDLFELYKDGMMASVRQQLSSAGPSEQDITDMLQAVAVANHLDKRRTFSGHEVQAALRERPEMLSIWHELRETERLPLVKVLADGEDQCDFQFRHLSFQEALVARAMQVGAPEAHLVIPSCSRCCELLEEAWCKNLFEIGAKQIASFVWNLPPEWSFSAGQFDLLVTHLGSFIEGCAHESLSLLFLEERSFVGFQKLTCLKRLKQCKVTIQKTVMEDVRALGEGLGGMEQLEILSLTCAGCTSLKSVQGFQELACLKMLKQCEMDFSHTEIEDTAALWMGLSGMEQLQTLSLIFSQCGSLKDVDGFERLAGLKMLRQCKMDFNHSAIKDVESLGAGLGGIKQLEALLLSFSLCGSLKDVDGFEHLAGLKKLKRCEMNFNNSQINDVECLGIGLGGMELLQALLLNFSACRSLEDVDGFEALAGLEMLTQCDMDFEGSGLIDPEDFGQEFSKLCLS